MPGAAAARGLARNPWFWRQAGDILPAIGRASAAFSLGEQGSSDLRWSFWGRLHVLHLLAPIKPIAWSPGRQHCRCYHGGTAAVPRPPSSWAQGLVLL